MDFNQPLTEFVTIGEFFMFLANPRPLGSEQVMVMNDVEFRFKVLANDAAADGASLDVNGVTCDDALQALQYVADQLNVVIPGVNNE